jgi:signal peptidase
MLLKILKWLISGAIGTIIILLLLVYFLPGYDISIVRSDSMRPAFAAGDMVITVPPGSFLRGEIVSGSIVALKIGDERITHRVVSIDQETFITKGDANEEADPRPVNMSQVTGVYLLKIPRVGYLSAFIRTKPGWFLAVVLPGVLLVGLIVKEIIKEALRIDEPAKAVVPGDKPLAPSSDTENDHRTVSRR